MLLFCPSFTQSERFLQTDQLIIRLQVVVVANFIRMLMRNVFVNVFKSDAEIWWAAIFCIKDSMNDAQHQNFWVWVSGSVRGSWNGNSGHSKCRGLFGPNCLSQTWSGLSGQNFVWPNLVWPKLATTKWSPGWSLGGVSRRVSQGGPSRDPKKMENQISRFFTLSRQHVHSSFLWGSFRGILVVLEGRGPQMCVARMTWRTGAGTKLRHHFGLHRGLRPKCKLVDVRKRGGTSTS